jgi:hypothetical protein
MFGARLAEMGMSIEQAKACGLIGNLTPDALAVLAAAHRGEAPTEAAVKVPGRLAASDDGVLGSDSSAGDNSDKLSVVSADARILVGEGSREGSGELLGRHSGSDKDLLTMLDGNKGTGAVADSLAAKKAAGDAPLGGSFVPLGGGYGGAFSAFGGGFNGFLGAPVADQAAAGKASAANDAASRLANLSLGF